MLRRIAIALAASAIVAAASIPTDAMARGFGGGGGFHGGGGMGGFHGGGGMGGFHGGGGMGGFHGGGGMGGFHGGGGMGGGMKLTASLEALKVEFGTGDVFFERHAEMRYRGQRHNIKVPVSGLKDTAAIREAFERDYRRRVLDQNDP